MPSITFVTAAGVPQTVLAEPGMSLMQAAINGGVAGILAECGGQAMCATCHVFIEPGQGISVRPLSADEDALLDGAAVARRTTSRLSCQIPVTDDLNGLMVELPERQV